MESINTEIFMISAISTGLLALIFSVAAHHKLFNMYEVQGIIHDYKILPPKFVKPASFLISVAEVSVVVLLILPTSNFIGAVLALSILVLYTFAIGINLLRGRVAIDCGCGAGGQGISWFHVVRNLTYSVFAFIILSIPEQTLPSASAAATCLLCIAILWPIVVLFEQLLKTKSHIIVSELN